MALYQPTKDYDGGGELSRSASTDGMPPSLFRQDTALSLDYYYSGSAGAGSSSNSSLSSPTQFDNQSHIALSSPNLPSQPPHRPSFNTASSASSFFVNGPTSPASPTSASRSPSQQSPSSPTSPRSSLFSSNGGVKQPQRDSIGRRGKSLSGWMLRKTSGGKNSGIDGNEESAVQSEERKSRSPVAVAPTRAPAAFESDDASSSGGEDGVVDISWARKMVEELEAEGSSSSDGGGPGVGGSESRGDLADMGSDEDEAASPSFPSRHYSSSSGSSFYNGTPSSANPPFDFPSPPRSSFSPPRSSPLEPLSPSHDSEITPRLPQFSHSNPSSPSNSSTHTTTEGHLRQHPTSPGNGSSNRRIAVMEASPGPSPSTSSSSFSDHALPPQPRRMSISRDRDPHVDSQNLAERRGLSASRLAFVAPPDASRRSIGELRTAIDDYGTKAPRRGSGGSSGGRSSAPAGRTTFDREQESQVVNLDEDLDLEPPRSGGRLAALASEASRDPADLSTVEEDTDDTDRDSLRRPREAHLREPGSSSPALQAARERAKKARSVHLATLQSFSPPSSTSTLSSASSSFSMSTPSRPVLSADTSSAAFMKATSASMDSPLDSGLWTPAIGESKELGVGVAGPQMLGTGPWEGRRGSAASGEEGSAVERPKRSEMRPSRTPSPTKSNFPSPNSSSEPTLARTTSHHVREPAAVAMRAPPSNQPQAAKPPPSTAPLDASTSGSSISNAQTLEELTAAVDRAINDAEIKESLALRSDLDFRGAASSSTKESSSTPARELTLQKDPSLDLDDYVMVNRAPEPSRALLPKPSRSPGLSRKANSTPPSNVGTVGAKDSFFPSPSLPSQPSPQPVESSKPPAVRRTSSLASLQPAPIRPPLSSQSPNLPPQASSSMAGPPQSPLWSSLQSASGPSTPVFQPAFAVGQERPWPAAMVFSDVRPMRSAGDRANAYARKIAELGRSDTGLGEWVRAGSGFKDEPLRSSMSSRPSSSSPFAHPHPSSRPSNALSASHSYASSASLYAPSAGRNVSTSSAISEEAFPLRAGHQTQAQTLRNISPPSGPPPNLPYPQLAYGMGMRSSISSASVRAGAVGGGFLQALGRRGSTSGGSRPKNVKGGSNTSKSPPLTLSGLPGGANGSGSGSGGRAAASRTSLESPRRPSVRDMGISSPTGWTKGSGAPDTPAAMPMATASSVPMRTTSISGPAGPRARHPSLPTTASSLNLAAAAFNGRRSSDIDPPPPSTNTNPPTSQPMRSSLSSHAEGVASKPFARAAKDAELREMVEMLGEDERVLAEYLRREGSSMAAIGAYLEDKNRGTVLRV